MQLTITNFSYSTPLFSVSLRYAGLLPVHVSLLQQLCCHTIHVSACLPLDIFPDDGWIVIQIPFTSFSCTVLIKCKTISVVFVLLFSELALPLCFFISFPIQ